MQWQETTSEFKFSRGYPALGWVFTAALLGCLLFFLGPLLQGVSLEEIWNWAKQASMGSLCIAAFAVGLLVLIVLSVVNGMFAFCCVVFDKNTAQVRRDWRLGPLHRYETHSFEDVAAVAYTATNQGENDAPFYSYRLKCYFKDDKDYDLTTSGDQQAMIALVQRLRSFLNLPADGTMHYEAVRLARKVAEMGKGFAAAREKSTLGPLSGAMADLLTGQLEWMQAALERTIPKPVNPDAPLDELLARLRAEPKNATLHLQVAEILRKQQHHAEAAAALEQAVGIMAWAAANDEASPRRPAVHPVDSEQMHRLWAKVRERPATAEGYFDLSLALRAHGWIIGSAGCLKHAALLQQADGTCSPAKAAEMIREADAVWHRARR